MKAAILPSMPTISIAMKLSKFVSPVLGDEDFDGVDTTFLYTCTLSPFASS